MTINADLIGYHHGFNKECILDPVVVDAYDLMLAACRDSLHHQVKPSIFINV